MNIKSSDPLAVHSSHHPSIKKILLHRADLSSFPLSLDLTLKISSPIQHVHSRLSFCHAHAIYCCAGIFPKTAHASNQYIPATFHVQICLSALLLIRLHVSIHLWFPLPIIHQFASLSHHHDSLPIGSSPFPTRSPHIT